MELAVTSISQLHIGYFLSYGMKMRRQVLSLYRRFERLIRYVLVGGGVALFYSLLTAGMVSLWDVRDTVLASAIASLITMPVSYFVHRRITYVDAAHDPAQWKRYSFLAASNFVINVGLMAAVGHLLWPYWIALVTGWIVVPIANHIINVLLVFRTKSFFTLDAKDADQLSSDETPG